VALQAASYGADFPGDPADRLIAATAQLLGAKLVTADDRLRAAKVVDTLW
jgi:PIN domain nuclease of toxin-antitoxin system